jgi:2-polyprenyl-3-methyl-5-hydroxy-6-metoxy-1,4-benzoquinol methylase
VDTVLEFFAEGPEGGNNPAAPSTNFANYGEILSECVACGSREIAPWRTKRFQYTQAHSQEKFDIYRCNDCGTGFLNPPPHVQWLKAIYQYSGHGLTQPITLGEVLAREARFPNSTLDAERMARCADQLNATGNKTALDIGSGFGFYTQALRKLDYRTVSINPGQYENAVFKQLNGDDPIPVMLEDFHAKEPFGIVMMSQVLEHLLEPERAIRKVASMLTAGGILACAVPNFESFAVRLLGTRDNACLWVPEHVNYFTADGLKMLLENNGFQVVRTEQVTRIPVERMSRRFRMGGKLASMLETMAVRVQEPIGRAMNGLGMGIYLNIYAVKSWRGLSSRSGQSMDEEAR